MFSRRPQPVARRSLPPAPAAGLRRTAVTVAERRRAPTSARDLQFILDQIMIAERARGRRGRCSTSCRTRACRSACARSTARTTTWCTGRPSSARPTTLFPRLLDPVFRNADDVLDRIGPPGGDLLRRQTSGIVFDCGPAHHLQPDRRPDRATIRPRSRRRRRRGRHLGTADDVLKDGVDRHQPRPRRHLRHRRRHRTSSVRRTWRPTKACRRRSTLDDVLRPVLRPRPRPRDQGRQRHGLHPAAADDPLFAGATASSAPATTAADQLHGADARHQPARRRRHPRHRRRRLTSTPTRPRRSSTRTRPTPRTPRTRSSCARMSSTPTASRSPPAS